MCDISEIILSCQDKIGIEDQVDSSYYWSGLHWDVFHMQLYGCR